MAAFSTLSPGQKFIVNGPGITAATPAGVFMRIVPPPGAPTINFINTYSGLTGALGASAEVIPITTGP